MHGALTPLLCTYLWHGAKAQAQLYLFSIINAKLGLCVWEWPASRPGRFSPWERSFNTHRIVGWVGLGFRQVWMLWLLYVHIYVCVISFCTSFSFYSCEGVGVFLYDRTWIWRCTKDERNFCCYCSNVLTSYTQKSANKGITVWYFLATRCVLLSLH